MDVLVKFPETPAIPLHGEAGNDPDHEPKEVDNRAHVVEDRPKTLVAKIVNMESRALGCGAGEPISLAYRQR